MTTGQKIAARRKELELSQEALGDKLGVSGTSWGYPGRRFTSGKATCLCPTSTSWWP